jgi:hypothetical protein
MTGENRSGRPLSGGSIYQQSGDIPELDVENFRVYLGLTMFAVV